MTATETPRRYRLGEKVTPDPDFPGLPSATLGRVFTVAKVNPRNLRCSADDGGRGINFPAEALLPATDENVGKHAAPRPFQPTRFYSMGEIVTLKRAAHGIAADTPLVVVADKGEKINVTRLGGDNDRYLRIQREGVEPRSMEWLAERLLEEATS